jgi:hypothetical protein
MELAVSATLGAGYVEHGPLVASAIHNGLFAFFLFLPFSFSTIVTIIMNKCIEKILCDANRRRCSVTPLSDRVPRLYDAVSHIWLQKYTPYRRGTRSERGVTLHYPNLLPSFPQNLPQGQWPRRGCTMPYLPSRGI